MRQPVLLAFLALALAACLLPAAQAQAPAPTLLIAVSPPMAPIGANETPIVAVRLTRVCPNQAMALDTQSVDVAIRGTGNITVDGPVQEVFQQQVCAQQPRQDLTLVYQVHVDAAAFTDDVEIHPFTVSARLVPTTVTQGSPESQASFTIATAARPPAPLVVEETERESPGLGLLGALAAFAAVAASLRRRED